MIIEKVELIERTFDNFVSKIDTRNNRLRKALLKTQGFETTFAEFLETVDNLQKRLDEERPLDARFDELKAIKQEHEVGSSLLFDSFLCSFVFNNLNLDF